jgi:hypothetical protein
VAAELMNYSIFREISKPGEEPKPKKPRVSQIMPQPSKAKRGGGDSNSDSDNEYDENDNSNAANNRTANSRYVVCSVHYIYANL